MSQDYQLEHDSLCYAYGRVPTNACKQFIKIIFNK